MEHDLSLLALFLRADAVVKAVMLLLVLASVLTWAIIFQKLLVLRQAAKAATDFASMVEGSRSDLLEATDTLTRHLILAAKQAWQDRGSQDYPGGETRAERRSRIERAMRGPLTDALKQWERGLPMLATVGSVAPFVGLFGTVWGIMNSFAAIAQSQDTSLSAVAPGLAEALFATAIGLVAAIPAVIAYNRLAAALADLNYRFSRIIGEHGNNLTSDRRLVLAAVEAAE